MFRLFEPADHSVSPGAPSLVLFGRRWVICEYAQLADAPPYTCLSYAWGKAKVQDPLGQGKVMWVIPPFLAGCIRRIHAAIFSFWAGVMPPMPMVGRSLL